MYKVKFYLTLVNNSLSVFVLYNTNWTGKNKFYFCVIYYKQPHRINHINDVF